MSFSAQQRAFWIALPVVSFLSSLSFVVLGTLQSGGGFDGKDLLELAYVIAVYTLFMVPFVAVAGLFVGLPVALGLRRLHATGAVLFVLAGATAGSLFSGLLLGAFAINKTTDVFLWAALIGLIPGATAGFLWWRIVERTGALDA
ncbi:MAG: hypothetical protein ABIQ98_03645 [Sphingomicrobium sp.]